MAGNNLYLVGRAVDYVPANVEIPGVDPRDCWRFAAYMCSNGQYYGSSDDVNDALGQSVSRDNWKSLNQNTWYYIVWKKTMTETSTWGTMTITMTYEDPETHATAYYNGIIGQRNNGAISWQAMTGYFTYMASQQNPYSIKSINQW